MCVPNQYDGGIDPKEGHSEKVLEIWETIKKLIRPEGRTKKVKLETNSGGQGSSDVSLMCFNSQENWSKYPEDSDLEEILQRWDTIGKLVR